MNKALEYALKLLAKKDYTEQEIRQKFNRRQVDETEAKAALLFLKEKSFIDDTRYARNYQQTHGSRGAVRIKYELAKRGVCDQIISELFSQNDSERETAKAKEAAIYWLSKKSAKYEDKYKLKQNLMSRLSRQGFEYDIVIQIANELFG